ncbi:hypothetical protein ACFOLA_00930 [Salinicoccus hispanicus]|uniref:Uncharacterized protein n=1 Tax=Salinicoccus hispanicus TaxID=157225 RepID=A0A6N8TW49_9STAP|nr:hypothetical protein [Salinicoccus hispanicus]MXQ50148.1 hypothetical protein [Salinicoccus hispanicus]
MKWFRYSLPILMMLYPIVWFVIILNMTDDVPFIAAIIVMTAGIMISPDIKKRFSENMTLDALISRILFSTALIGLITHNLVTELTINQFIVIFLAVYFTSELMLYKFAPLRRSVVSMAESTH